MKKLLIIILSLFIQEQAISQVYCSYSGGGCANGLIQPTQYAINVVQDICETLNIPYISIYAGNVGNACASNYNGSPIITYNVQFMNFLANSNEWAAISVLAHEVGHHVNYDISWYGSLQHPWTKELRADFISGYVLYKMGARLIDAQSTFYIMFDWMGTRSHPNSALRIDALASGYYHAANGY